MTCDVKECFEKSVVIVHYPTNMHEVLLCQQHYNRWIYKDFKHMRLPDHIKKKR